MADQQNKPVALIEIRFGLRPREKAWEAEPYDGVLGRPPEWVPESVYEDFRSYRDQLLHFDGWSPEQVANFMDADSTGGGLEWARGLWTTPRGRPLDKAPFFLAISFLADLKRTVSSGPEMGLRKLVGAVAVRGYQMQQGSKKGGGDLLSKVMTDALRRLRKSDSAMRHTWRDVLNKLERDYRGLDVIEEIYWEEEEISWLTKDGHPKATSFKKFRDRLTRIKNLSENEIPGFPLTGN